MQAPRELSITAALDLIRQGSLTAQKLVESCLERIHEREEAIHAWVQVYEKEALEEARRCDNEFHAGEWRGDLHGIPIGVKDIIHVKGMWTRAGCSVYPAQVADSDAPAVHHLRAAGAVILGKTESTPFALTDPTITRNPWNTEHTPGGSSSGSGAAVADRMCLAALGTQTGGSVLRPAAYNGIVGFKPTYGTISVEGVIPLSWSLDHVGSLARSVDDANILYRLMRVAPSSPFAYMPVATKAAVIGPPGTPPRLGLIGASFEREPSPEVVQHLASVREKFVREGAIVVDLDLPEHMAESVLSAHRTIMETEISSCHRTLFESHRKHYPPNLTAAIERGTKIPGYQYVEALRQRINFQEEMGEILSTVDAALMPTAHSPAPKGLASTGSPALCTPWSLMGFPSISIPSGLDDQGLPFAVQLAALPMAEEKLIAVASWFEGVLAFEESPPA